MVLPLPLKNKEVLKVDKEIARDEVFRQLAEVYDPELDQPLTELGFIGGVDIAGEKLLYGSACLPTGVRPTLPT